VTQTEIYKQIVAVASAVLTGAKGIVEASREMRPMLLSLDEDVSGLDCVQTILAIESETDDEPIGEQRELWAPALLEERDRNLKEYVARVQSDAETACRQLVHRFGR
jgi:hypothetical protein